MSDTATLTLTDFLLARIAEDERALCESSSTHWDEITDWMVDGLTRERLLAECEAKRRIIRDHAHGEAWCDYCGGYEDKVGEHCLTIRHLAGVYADHPDYRDEWRP